MKKSIVLMVLATLCFSSERELLAMQKACDRKMPTACYEFGILYAEGLAVDKNITKSKQYFQKACDYGYDRACERLEQLGIEDAE